MFIINRPISIYSNSNLAQRLKEIKKKLITLVLLIPDAVYFVLFPGYASGPSKKFNLSKLAYLHTDACMSLKNSEARECRHNSDKPNGMVEDLTLFEAREQVFQKQF